MKVITQFGHYILRNRLHAGVFALLFAIAPVLNIPFIGWLATVIVGLVTLRQGIGEGLLVLGWSAIPAVVMAVLHADFFLLSQVLTSSFAVWFLAILLNARYNWSHLIEIVAWLAIAIVLMVHGSSMDIYGFWSHKLHMIVDQYNQQFADEGLQVSLSQSNVFYLTHLATGFFIAMILLNAAFNLMVARWWQAKLFNPGGFQREFLSIRMSYRLVIALLVCAVIAMLGVSWVYDLFPILLIAFFVGGFSVMNAWLMQLKNGRIWILLFLVLLVVRFIFIGAAVMIVAIIDSLLDIRGRWLVKKV